MALSGEQARVRLSRSTARRSTPRPATNGQIPPPSDDRLRLLLVEDEESVALTFGAVLEDAGYRVEAAASVVGD